MRMSVATRSVALSTLERKAGRKSRRKKRRGDPYPLEKTRSGGGKKSQRKGPRFQNVVAKLFSAYYGCSVRSTPGSGGWATVGDFGPRGDLVFSSRRAPYHVECKHQEGWDLSDLVTGTRGKTTTSTNSLEAWWDQTIRDCPKRKTPMLVFKRNQQKIGKSKTMGTPPLLMMRQDDFRKLGTVWKKAIALCSVCREPQFKTKHGDVCKNGHGGVEPADDTGIDGKAGKTALWCATDFIPHLSFSDDTGTRVVCQLSDFFKFVKPPKSSPRRKKWKRGVG